MADPGHQLAAQRVQFLLFGLRLLQLSRHPVKRAHQLRQFVAALHLDARVEFAGGDALGRPIERYQPIGQGRREKDAHRRRDAGGKHHQDSRQHQIVTAGKHQPRDDPHIQKDQHARQPVHGQQRPLQARPAIEPAQAVSGKGHHHRQPRGQQHQLCHDAEVAHGRIQRQVKQAQAHRQRQQYADNQATQIALGLRRYRRHTLTHGSNL